MQYRCISVRIGFRFRSSLVAVWCPSCQGTAIERWNSVVAAGNNLRSEVFLFKSRANQRSRIDSYLGYWTARKACWYNVRTSLILAVLRGLRLASVLHSFGNGCTSQ